MTHTPVAPATPSVAAPPPPAADAPPDAACRNCDAPMHGPYCAQCGQQAVHPDPTFHDVAHDAAHEFLHVDGKIVETLKLLFLEPGRLTLEHWRGRRVRYVAPIRLYLTLSLLYFVTVAVTSPVERAIARRSPVTMTEGPARLQEAVRVSDDSAARLMEAEGRKRGGVFGAFMAHAANVQRDKAGFARRVRAALPKIFFVFVPLFAAIVGLVYRRRRHYPAHLYFALHLFAFCFVAAALGRVLALAPGAEAPAGVLVVVAFLGYGVAALRRVYGGSWPQAVGRGALVAALSFVAFTLLSLVGMGIVFFTF